MAKWKNGKIKKRFNEWTNGQMEGYKDERIKGWMN